MIAYLLFQFKGKFVLKYREVSRATLMVKGDISQEAYDDMLHCVSGSHEEVRGIGVELRILLLEPKKFQMDA